MSFRIARLAPALLVLLALAGAPESQGDVLSLGLAGGINFTSTSSPTVISQSTPGVYVVSGGTLSGVSYAGSATVGVFTGSVLGLEAGLDYLGIDVSQNSVTLTGKLAVATAAAQFRFEWLKHFHRMGVGYAYGDFLNPSSSSTASIPSSMNGFAFLARDYLIVDRDYGPFMGGRLFYFVDSGTYSPLLNAAFVLGFEF